MLLNQNYDHIIEQTYKIKLATQGSPDLQWQQTISNTKKQKTKNYKFA